MSTNVNDCFTCGNSLRRGRTRQRNVTAHQTSCGTVEVVADTGNGGGDQPPTNGGGGQPPTNGGGGGGQPPQQGGLLGGTSPVDILALIGVGLLVLGR